jgi:plastocyanin
VRRPPAVVSILVGDMTDVTDQRRVMPRTTIRASLAAFVLAAGLAGLVVSTGALDASSIASAAPASQVVKGTVGPGFTITLTLGGKKVAKLKAGTSYRFVINDRADIHDFHLSGPGFNRVLTSVEFTGTKSFVLRLKKGTYRYVCDPHAGFMHGRFQVS